MVPPTFAFIFLLSAAAGAAPAPLTLEELVQRARGNDLRVQEAAAELERLRAQHREANWAGFPRFESTFALAGPIPEARNDGLGGPPTQESFYRYNLDFGRPGVLVRYELNAFLPLFTFGKLGALEAAAQKGVDAGEALRERARNEAGLQAAQAFFGYQLAREGQATLAATLERLDEAAALVDELLLHPSPQVSRMDLHKVRYFRMQLQSRLAQAQSGRKLALAAVRVLVGAAADQPLPLEERELDLPGFELLPEERYLQAAFEHSPELRAIRAGLFAREQEVFIRKRMFLPDLGLAGYFRWMHTTSATRQYSPFAYDPYHDLSGGVALVARATFDLPVKSAQLDQARAELAKLQLQARQLEALISLEVQRAHAGLVEALERGRALEEAERSARRWAAAAFAGFELGTIDARELTDAFLALAQSAGEKSRAWHDAHLGLFLLSRAVGTDVRRLEEPPEPRR